jgi:hypothetical protein
MPAAPAQRVQVLLKPKVLEIVKELSVELDLTLSKTVAMLVYEALETRGVKVKPSSSVLTDIKIPSTDPLRFSVPDHIEHTTVTKKTEELDPEDLDLLKKIKTLKTLGLF